MNKPLKQAVRDHMNAVSLDDEKLAKLTALAGEANGKAYSKKFSLLQTIMAAIVLAFFVSFIITSNFVTQASMHEKIAMEVAKNHIKLKPLEVESNDIETIRDYFEELDFVPVNSQIVLDAGMEILGGRYCSLQGVTAAQIRLKTENNADVQTLYQVEYHKDVFENIPSLEEGDMPVEIIVKGIKVVIWKEKGLLFALTESI